MRGASAEVVAHPYGSDHMDLIPHATRVDLKAKTRAKVVELINARLADAIDLRSHLRQAHWNVRGPRFIALHELFDELTAGLDAQIDDLAERAGQLGGVSIGLVRDVAKASSLPEYPRDAVSGSQHVDAVADSLATVANRCREAIDSSDKAGDTATADLFTGLTRFLDKSLWLVEAHQQAKD